MTRSREVILVTMATLLFSCFVDSAKSGENVAPQISPVPRPSLPDIFGLWEPAIDLRTYQPDQAVAHSKPEFTPEYQAKHEYNLALNRDAEHGAILRAPNSFIVRRMGKECLPYGMPQMMSMTGFGMQYSLDFGLAKNHITILGENGENDFNNRRIWLDREQLPVKDVQPSFFGRSVGKWEGDVLVVTTNGIREDLEGEEFTPHSPQMVVTERIYLKDGLLINDITITDPPALKKAWKYSFQYKRPPADYEPSEGTCENTNRYRYDEKGNVIVE